MTLNADSTFSLVTYTRPRHIPGREEGATTVRHDAGHYSRCGATIHFNSNTQPDYSATIHGTTFTVLVPVIFLSPGSSGRMYALVFSQNVREVVCGSAAAGPVVASGAYELLTVDSVAPPVTLPNTYPYAVTIASATTTIASDSYRMVGRGSVNIPDSANVEVFADSGRIVSCPRFVHFVSVTHDSTFESSVSPATLKIYLPASFVKFEYDFFGGDPIILVLSKAP